MNKIIGIAFLTLITRTLSDDCEGVRFGFYGIAQSLYIFEDGTVNPKGGEKPMILELPSDLYTGKVSVNALLLSCNKRNFSRHKCSFWRSRHNWRYRKLYHYIKIK